MSNKFKLSFNKRSATDILSVVFVLAGVLVVVGNGLGFTVSSDQIDSWAAIILQIVGGLGLARNTSTGTSSPQKVNVSSDDALKVLDLGAQLASTAVSELAVNPDLTKQERKKVGVKQVLGNLSDLGLKLDTKTVAGLVERAYQFYEASGGKSVDVTVTPAPTEVINPEEGEDSDE
ncbi:phage holin, LLH family [Levilactobacillus brevis]|uniref:phage holin, LLH family n=1 Tax=Levilactobacillus brevis TaxID=1580 RepID=UPI000E096B72|nr:phage holin, LLH family [Levilactobacillus brevis]RDF84455.1 hypothetical protein DQM16_09200 [Levilactobacillus brevis]